MLKAITLVHKGAMEIGVHSIRSFAFHFAKTHSLDIHADPSIDDNDHQLLMEAANGMQAKIVTAAERANKIEGMLSKYPKTKEFLNRASYFAKLELCMYEETPYLYFDSDIIWLRHVTNLSPKNSPNAFSTESWTWYPGIIKKHLWIKAKTPRRVNSGFQYIGQKFPYEKMEGMLMQEMFDREILYSGDQEIYAYLFNEMEYYHPEDLKRSRVGSIYNLKEETCAALHFPGKMWQHHIEQIKQLPNINDKPSMEIRYEPLVPLTSYELLRMRVQIKIGTLSLLRGPLNLMRKLRRR